MSDYAVINNTCPEITLWQQYRKNDAAVNFFNWLATYWQSKYFDKLLTVFAPALGLCDNNTDYLQFFARYMYGVIRPVDVTNSPRYDENLTYDASVKYDEISDAGVIDLESFRRLLKFIVNWTIHDWNIPTLYRMIQDFTLVAGSDIVIEQDSTRLDVFLVQLPSSNQTILFKSLILNYKKVWGLPFGIDLEITLV